MGFGLILLMNDCGFVSGPQAMVELPLGNGIWQYIGISSLTFNVTV